MTDRVKNVSGEEVKKNYQVGCPLLGVGYYLLQVEGFLPGVGYCIFLPGKKKFPGIGVIV
jgi:hypothetical protein